MSIMEVYIAWDYSVPGISFNVVTGRITIFKTTLAAMGYLEYFRFLFSPEDRVFGIEPYAIDDGGAQRLPEEIAHEQKYPKLALFLLKELTLFLLPK